MFYRVVYSNNPAISFTRPKYPQTKWNPRKDTIIWPSFSWPMIKEFWPIRTLETKQGLHAKAQKIDQNMVPFLGFHFVWGHILKDVPGLISDNNSVRPCYGEEEDLRWRSPTVSHWPGLAINTIFLQCIFGRDYHSLIHSFKLLVNT